VAFNFFSKQQTCSLKSKAAATLKQATDDGGKPWHLKYMYYTRNMGGCPGATPSQLATTKPTAGVQCASMSGSGQYGKCTQAGCLFDTSTKVCSANGSSAPGGVVTTAPSITGTATAPGCDNMEQFATGVQGFQEGDQTRSKKPPPPWRLSVRASALPHNFFFLVRFIDSLN
jgi:hypothetical protein